MSRDRNPDQNGSPDQNQSQSQSRSRRRAVIRTTHDDPALVARALRPDNTPEIDTRVRGDRTVTTIDRERTGGLQTTVDDYVVNLTVATRIQTANQPAEHDYDYDYNHE